MPTTLDRSLIDEAAAFLEPVLAPTPVEESPALSRLLGRPVHLKLEFLQPTGSFKIRGALFRLSRLTPAERRRGVVACSVGNHGLGLAHGARELEVPLRVYVPARADAVKVNGMRELGAEVVCSPFDGWDETVRWATREEGGGGRLWISAFDDHAVMAGNGGSLAAEILRQVPDVGAVVLPVGGGGMAAGLAFLVKSERPETRIVAAQLRSSPALALSLERGAAVTELPHVETLAHGVEGGMGALCFEVLRRRVDQVVLVDEEEIVAAMLWMLDEHRYLVEPSAAVALAACLGGEVAASGEPLVLILSGRNVERSVLREVLSDAGHR